MAIKVRFLKETLHEDAMWGVGSVTTMHDEGRAKYFIGMLQAEKAPADAPESKAPVVPPVRNSNQAEEIGRVIANAMAKGLTNENIARQAAEAAAADAEAVAAQRGRKIA